MSAIGSRGPAGPARWVSRQLDDLDRLLMPKAFWPRNETPDGAVFTRSAGDVCASTKPVSLGRGIARSLRWER